MGQSIVNTNATKTTNVIKPEIMAKMISAKLENAIQISKILDIDYSLVAEQGLTLKVPKWEYAGAAITVNEGEEIPVSQLTSSTTSVTVKKYGKSYELTDEAMMSSTGDVVNETIKQATVSIADAIDKDALTTALGVTKAKYDAAGTSLTVDDIFKAKIGFGEHSTDETYLLISTKMLLPLLLDDKWKNSVVISNNVLIRGYQGTLAGCNIILTDRLPDKKAVMLQKGAIKLLLKRETLIETERKAGVSTRFVATKHAIPYVFDDSKIINITIK